MTFATSERTVGSYLGDLTDADLLVVPIPGMHPIALQLGHLISVENWLGDTLSPGSMPALPDGFKENHNVKSPPADSSGYLTKAEYQSIWDAQRTAIKGFLESIAESELEDTHDGKLPPFAPTVAAVLNAVGLHPLMHAGQFVAVRRSLNKPIAF